MYHSHRYANVGWPGEPEVDITQDYEDRKAVEGWELHPQECLKFKLAYQVTLRERFVTAGVSRIGRDPEGQRALIHIHVKVPAPPASSTSTPPPDFYVPQSMLPWRITSSTMYDPFPKFGRQWLYDYPLLNRVS
jgi:hypothetical protein